MSLAYLPSELEAGAPGAPLTSLDDLSLEATPKQLNSVPDLAARLPRGTSVYVPFLPSGVLAESVAAARTLRAHGLHPVPHLPARALSGLDHLRATLEQYRAAGVDSLLLIAGDVAQPAGPFVSTLEVLATGLLPHCGIHHIGVAGHPEGHPFADETALLAALRTKAAYARDTHTAMWLVTQFVFDLQPVVDWQTRLRAAGIHLPVRVGVPGPAKMRTLLAFALQCGVGASARALSRRPETLRLLGRWSPGSIVADLAAHQRAEPTTLLRGTHVFPFGGLNATLDWLATLRQDDAQDA